MEIAPVSNMIAIYQEMNKIGGSEAFKLTEEYIQSKDPLKGNVIDTLA